jgi:hypothetical protein
VSNPVDGESSSSVSPAPLLRRHGHSSSPRARRRTWQWQTMPPAGSLPTLAISKAMALQWHEPMSLLSDMVGC